MFERRHRRFEGGLPRRRRGSSAQDVALAGPDKRFALLASCLVVLLVPETCVVAYAFRGLIYGC